jgi:hypothetical protein
MPSKSALTVAMTVTLSWLEQKTTSSKSSQQSILHMISSGISYTAREFSIDSKTKRQTRSSATASLSAGCSRGAERCPVVYHTYLDQAYTIRNTCRLVLNSVQSRGDQQKPLLFRACTAVVSLYISHISVASAYSVSASVKAPAGARSSLCSWAAGQQEA